jgi:hypothetical protein
MDSLSKNIDFYPVFILIMIISSNFLAEIFPCRFQELMTSNNYIKHIFGYLTLVFFVSLNIKELSTDLTQLFIKSLYLYFGFILLTRTNKETFMAILTLLGILYILHLKTTMEQQKIDNLKKNDSKEPELSKYQILEIEQNINKLDKYKQYTKNIIILLLVIGFTAYLGEKKLEYGKDFNYTTFLLGNPSCKSYSPSIQIFNALKNAFTPVKS